MYSRNSRCCSSRRRPSTAGRRGAPGSAAGRQQPCLVANAARAQSSSRALMYSRPAGLGSARAPWQKALTNAFFFGGEVHSAANRERIALAGGYKQTNG
eukprot:scaffold8492_cov71-Phaeocystis_antarctica.AAC.2